MSTEEPSTAALAVFLAAVGTDLVDGYIARRTGRVTSFGQLIDPLADKVLIACALVPLALQDRFAEWALVVIFARELVVSLLRWIGVRQGVVMPATRLGKFKMETHVLLVLVAMSSSSQHDPGVQAATTLAVAATVVSGIAYFVAARGLSGFTFALRGNFSGRRGTRSVSYPAAVPSARSTSTREWKVR
jgi:CDP-diacylglycerol--glycerol-3-phosphate 3-phosphatidyltransferase